MQQISLPLDWDQRGAAGRFLVSDANAAVARHLEGWGAWPVRTSILAGPPRGGKTLLGQIFVRKSGGTLIDEVETAEEEAVFHAWNRAQENHKPLLLITRHDPAAWAITLPDLRSRIAAAPVVRIEQPDDALATALIEQGLAARGAGFPAELPAWLVKRIERSYVAIEAAIQRLDDAALSQGRKLTLPFARQVLGEADMLGDPGRTL